MSKIEENEAGPLCCCGCLRMHVRRGSSILAKKEIATSVATMIMFIMEQLKSHTFNFITLPHVILSIFMIPAAVFVIRVASFKHNSQLLLPFLIIGPLLILSLILAIVADALAIDAAGSSFCNSFFACTPVIHIIGSILGIFIGIWSLIVVGQFYQYLKSIKQTKISK